MPVYRKLGDSDMWLMYHSASKKWMIVKTANKGADKCVAFLYCGYCLPVQGPKCKWQMADIDDNFKKDNGIVITIVAPNKSSTVGGGGEGSRGSVD